jgi:hypothetical protein
MEVSSVAWSSFRSAGALLLLACSGLHSTYGGGGGGTSGTGGSGGSSGGAGGGSGGSSGTGGGLSFGVYQAADAGAFMFQDITPTGGSGSALERIAGTSKTDVYVGDSSGSIQHFDGQTFSTLVTFPSELGFSGLYTPGGGALYASGIGKRVYWCTGGCDMLTSWNYEDHDGVEFGGLCGGGIPVAVYAVGRLSADDTGVVYVLSATNTWEELSGARFAKDYAGCAVGSDGTVYVAANRYVIEIDPGGTAFQTDVTGPDLIGLTQWNAIGLMGNEVVMVGDKKRVARRTAGQWTLLLDYPNYDPAGWYGVTSSHAGEALIGGDGSDSIVNIGAFGIVNDTPTVTTFKAPTDFLMRAIWAADDHTIFMSGETNVLESSTHDEVIYRVTR